MDHIKSHALNRAPGLMQRFREYFGVDLQQLPQMSDQEWGQIADRANDMKRLTEALPILEQHFETLIQGQLQYEEFSRKVLKEAEKAGKKIDKAVMDAWLTDRGYAKHLQLMRQKAGLDANLQDAEFASLADLNQMDFQTALQLVRMKHQRQAAQIQQRVPDAVRSMQQAEQQRQDTQRRNDLLTKGTRGVMGRVASFFGGR